MRGVPLALAAGKAVGAVLVVFIFLRKFYQVTQGTNKQTSIPKKAKEKKYDMHEMHSKIF